MKKSKKTALFSWLFAIVLLLVSAFTLFHHVLQIESGIRRSLSAVQTQGIVLDTYRTPGGDTSDVYHVTYQFEAEGKQYQNSSEISRDQMQQIEPGASISVFYLPGQPENSKALQSFDPGSDLFKNLLIAILALFFLAGSICILWGNIQTLRTKQNTVPPPKAGQKAPPS